jgi:hypothetical protein
MHTAGGQGTTDFETSSVIISAGAKASVATSSSNQEAEHIYTFYDDIRYIPEIHEIASATQIVVQNGINNMKKFLVRFRDFKHLWRTDKVNKSTKIRISNLFIFSSWRYVRNFLLKIHR